MQQNLKTKLTITGITLGILLIVSYAYFEARNLILGPTITIEYPENGASHATASVVVTGTAKRTSFLTLNNNEIFVDTEGNFREKLLLQEGYTIIELKALDRFNRTVSLTRELYRPPTDNDPLETDISIIASSSPATTTQEIIEIKP